MAILWKLIINTGTSSPIKILYIILLCNSDVLDFDIEFLFLLHDHVLIFIKSVVVY